MPIELKTRGKLVVTVQATYDEKEERLKFNYVANSDMFPNSDSIRNTANLTMGVLDAKLKAEGVVRKAKRPVIKLEVIKGGKEDAD